MTRAQVSQPVRVQRQRSKGWRMPEGAVYVGRPSRWGNPFVAGRVKMLALGYDITAEFAHLHPAKQEVVLRVARALAAAVTAEREASVAAIEELWHEDCAGNRRPERCASCRAYDGAIRRVRG